MWLERAEQLLHAALAVAPFDPQRLVLERLLREAYPEAVRDGSFEPLRGRWLRIELLAPESRLPFTPSAAGWNVTLGRDGLLVSAGPVEWDVRIAAQLDDFVLLANQQADPDTLFFQRRLVIEGDTELGLVVKNLIFGSELAGLPATMARLVLDVRDRFRPRENPFGGVRRLDAARRSRAAVS